MEAIAVDNTFENDFEQSEVEPRISYPCYKSLIGTLPFKKTGRMLIIYDDSGKTVPTHRDRLETKTCHEFFRLRTNLKKPFYMLNSYTNKKKYVESDSVWFDSVNQYHGSAAAAAGLTLSLRVDGAFTDEFKELIPKPPFNPAATPALRACISYKL